VLFIPHTSPTRPGSFSRRPPLRDHWYSDYDQITTHTLKHQPQPRCRTSQQLQRYLDESRVRSLQGQDRPTRRSATLRRLSAPFLSNISTPLLRGLKQVVPEVPLRSHARRQTLARPLRQACFPRDEYVRSRNAVHAHSGGILPSLSGWRLYSRTCRAPFMGFLRPKIGKYYSRYVYHMIWRDTYQ
jgi:hypothetical protein